MHVEKLPESKLLIVSHVPAVIADAIREVVKFRTFTHGEVIQGANRSGRILYTHAQPGSTTLPFECLPEDIAWELAKLQIDARYHSRPATGAMRGWEIRHATYPTEAIIVWAAWCQ